MNILVHAANHHPPLNVKNCGGMFRESSPTFEGTHAESFFLSTKAHTYFLRAVDINLSDSITEPAPIEIRVKRAMRRSANKIVLLIDSSKFGKRSLAEIIPIAGIDVLFTDKNAPEEMALGLRRLGVDVHVAE